MSAIGRTLSVLTRVAGSEFIGRMGLRRPAQELASRAVRGGVALGEAATRGFQALSGLTEPARLSTPKARDRFDLIATDEQVMIRSSAARVASDHFRPAAMGASEACSAPAEVMAKVEELGLTHYAIPEALGGAGNESSPVTGAIVAETLAHGDMGLSLAALSPVGVVNTLVRWGSASQQATYLPAFLEQGGLPAALALMEPQPLADPFSVRTRATPARSGFVLRGKKTLVPLAETAKLFLVSARVEGNRIELFLVERDAPGVSIQPAPAMGLRAASLGCLELADVQVGASALLGEGRAGAFYEELIDRARVGWCALATGTAQAVLDYVVEYCNGRTAFGEPITNRQAVAFIIADIAIELESMRLLTQRAASRAEQGLSFHREAYLARVFAAERATQIGTNGVQLLGGHGYVKEHPVERWYRDLTAVGLMEGGFVV